MANEEHLAILKQGVKVWNKWRTNNPEVRPELSNANLRRADLRRADLSEADLGGADLRRADLSEADLNKAILNAANLSGLDLSGLDFSGLDLSGAILSEAILSRAVLRGVNLSKANLSGAIISNVNLSGADLSGADLSGADLSEAIIRRANLSGAILRNVNLSGLDLSNVNLKRANLSGAILRNVNLSGLDLSGAILSNVNLSGLDLSGLNLSEADFCGATLRKTQALNTNFEGANFTGVCIQDWNTNSGTKLDGIVCDYIYLKFPNKERRPHSSNFAPGEFAKLFQKALETVDIIFSNGIDWTAFLTSYQKLQIQCGGDELSIQAIENKNDGTFIIRVNVPTDANKEEIEKYVKREYEIELKAINEKYRDKLRAKDEQLADHRKHNTDLIEIVKLLANRPINIEAKAVAENKSENVTNEVQMNFHAPVTGAAGKVQTMNIYTPEQRQTLAEAAAEIQQLLKQLEENNPTATEAEKEAYITAAIPVTRRKKFWNALQACGKAAIEEFLDNPYVNVAIATIEGWKEGE